MTYNISIRSAGGGGGGTFSHVAQCTLDTRRFCRARARKAKRSECIIYHVSLEGRNSRATSWRARNCTMLQLFARQGQTSAALHIVICKCIRAYIDLLFVSNTDQLLHGKHISKAFPSSARVSTSSFWTRRNYRIILSLIG